MIVFSPKPVGGGAETYCPLTKSYFKLFHSFIVKVPPSKDQITRIASPTVYFLDFLSRVCLGWWHHLPSGAFVSLFVQT